MILFFWILVYTHLVFNRKLGVTYRSAGVEDEKPTMIWIVEAAADQLSESRITRIFESVSSKVIR